MQSALFFEFDTVIIAPPRRLGERFECDPPDQSWRHAWDVTRANQILWDVYQRRQHLERLVRYVLSPPAVSNFLQSGTEFDPAHVWSADCDPRRPIVCVHLAGEDWIIDGWHRVRRAIGMGWPEVPALILTPAEDFLCRICPCCIALRAAAATGRLFKPGQSPKG
jgi:hypothetical protein